MEKKSEIGNLIGGFMAIAIASALLGESLKNFNGLTSSKVEVVKGIFRINALDCLKEIKRYY